MWDCIEEATDVQPMSWANLSTAIASITEHSVLEVDRVNLTQVQEIVRGWRGKRRFSVDASGPLVVVKARPIDLHRIDLQPGDRFWNDPGDEVLVVHRRDNLVRAIMTSGTVHGWAEGSEPVTLFSRVRPRRPGGRTANSARRTRRGG